MKTLILYDRNTGDVISTISPVDDDDYAVLVADVSERGIYITGGGGLVWGLDKLIAEKTGIPVMIAEDAQSCVAIGTGKAVEHVELFESGNAIKFRKN